jgi:hypothetical protein
MPLRFETETRTLSVELARLIVAGWTGRDQAAVQHHIEELAEIGVPRPSRTPLFYEVSPQLATQAAGIAVLGAETSGEVEPFLVRIEGETWLGLASDHTDRGLEAHSVAHSKHICAKPVATRLWPLARVADRLDSLRLSSWIGEGQTRRLYQQGTLADILPLPALLEAAPLSEGEAMLCGTLPAIGGIVPAARYEMELADPAGGALGLAYNVATLPVVA